MTKLYLDCEFNSFHGSLISLALYVSPDHYFYQALELNPREKLHPWVKDHVIPVLDTKPVPPAVFQANLWNFMRENNNADIYADWPEDFSHLMNWCCAPNGMAPRIQVNMHLIQSGELHSHQPHNALEDARALCEWHQGVKE